MENNNGNKVNKFFVVISIVLCVLLIASLVSIGNLKDDVRSMRNNFSSSLSQVQNDMNGMSSQMYSYIEQKSSIIAYSDYDMGEIDVEERTVLFDVTISPKEYDEIETVAVFEIGGQRYDMTKEGSEFKAEIPLDMFGEYDNIKVAFCEGSSVRTELLEWYISPRGESLPMIYAQSLGGWRGGFDADRKNYIWTPSGEIQIEIDAYAKESISIKSAEIIYEIDGKEIYSQDMGSIIVNTSKDWSTVQEELTEEAEIPLGSTFMVYTELVDEYGLHHINVIERISIDNNGDIAGDDEDHIWRYGEQIIMDGDGNVLYDPYDQYAYAELFM